MAARIRPSSEQRRLLEVVEGRKLMRTQGDDPHYSLTDGTGVNPATAESCIKHGWLQGNRDGMFEGWSQSYSLSIEGIRQVEARR